MDWADLLGTHGLTNIWQESLEVIGAPMPAAPADGKDEPGLSSEPFLTLPPESWSVKSSKPQQMITSAE